MNPPRAPPSCLLDPLPTPVHPVHRTCRGTCHTAHRPVLSDRGKGSQRRPRAIPGRAPGPHHRGPPPPRQGPAEGLAMARRGITDHHAGKTTAPRYALGLQYQCTLARALTKAFPNLHWGEGGAASPHHGLTKASPSPHQGFPETPPRTSKGPIRGFQRPHQRPPKAPASAPLGAPSPALVTCPSTHLSLSFLPLS